MLEACTEVQEQFHRTEPNNDDGRGEDGGNHDYQNEDDYGGNTGVLFVDGRGLQVLLHDHLKTLHYVLFFQLIFIFCLFSLADVPDDQKYLKR